MQYRHLFRRDIVKRIIVDTMYSVTIMNGSKL